jgi:hypothetical protein
MWSVSKNKRHGTIVCFHKTMRPLNNRYISKSRMYNVSFKNQKINNVNFKGAIITKSSFKGAIITNCEFLGTNLSKCSFKNAKFVNCVFMGAKLSYANFDGASFENVIFVNCVFMGAKLSYANFDGASFENVIFVTQKTSDCYHIFFANESNTVIKKIIPLSLTEELKSVIDEYHERSKDRITHILKLTEKKYNFLHISILLKDYSEEQITNGLSLLIKKNQYDFPTIYALKKSLANT